MDPFFNYLALTYLIYPLPGFIQIKKYIFLILLSALSLSEGKTQKTIQFQPKEFNEIKLGYYENEMSVCTPDYPNIWGKINTLLINIPHGIICKKEKDVIPIIPICIRSEISVRRFYKYYDLAAQMIYVKK